MYGCLLLGRGDVFSPIKKFQYLGELILDFSGKKCIGFILSWYIVKGNFERLGAVFW